MSDIKQNEIIDKIKISHLKIKEFEINKIEQDYSVLYSVLHSDSDSDQVHITLNDLSDLLDIDGSDVINSLDLSEEESDLLIRTSLLLKAKSDQIDHKKTTQESKITKEKATLKLLIADLKEKQTDTDSLISVSDRQNELSYVSISKRHFDNEELKYFIIVLKHIEINFIETNSRICFLFKKEDKNYDIRDEIISHFVLIPLSVRDSVVFLDFKSLAQKSPFNFYKSELLSLL